MKITRFEKLETAVRELGGSKVNAGLIKELATGTKDVSPNELITGDAGIYYLTESGALTRVLVNIVDKDVRGGRFGRGIRHRIANADFDENDFIQSLHKYHLVRCQTIERAERENWRDKYKMSHRRDGRFFYRFISDSKVIEERTDQRLFVCLNCLRKISDSGIVPYRTNKHDFSPGSFFDFAEADELVGIKEGGEYAEQSVPNKYSDDWRLISRALKRNKGYQCEGLDCPSPDLSRQSLRRYLHTHHKDMDKTNNDFSNLEALCVYCHAHEPNHSHMKSSRDFKEYRDLVIENQRAAL